MSAVLEFDNLHYTFPGSDTPALRGASLRIEAGRRIALLGRNGAGKSTLFLHGNGILRPAAGQVRLNKRPLEYTRRGLLHVRRQVGLIFQNPDDQLFSASVRQDISFGPLNLGLSVDETRRRVAEAADLCGVSDLLDRPTHALSGGQKTRVALAGVLAMRPDILLVDEATSGLDPWMRQQVFDIFDRLVERGATVALATHDLDAAQYWADTVAVMDEGRVIAVAPSAQIFADPELRALLGPVEARGERREVRGER
ncbi:MAG: ATP-binding cassette domain-containing protein [Roseiflexaceae bacterium]|nr:ATP-binding cassette domain-containing protein [Roseiflexaceae bacterium]